jgi:hypothetical protein
MLATKMTVFVTLSCDVGYNDVTNTVIIVPDITWQVYKYCHHCTQHHMTRLQILSSLYPTSHDKVTNTVIIVPNITWQGPRHVMLATKMTVFVTLSCDVGYNDDSICNLVMWCWVQWWQYLQPCQSHVEFTNTIIIVPNITWQGYKYCHHCIWHHVTRL